MRNRATATSGNEMPTSRAMHARERRNEAWSAGRRTADVPEGSSAAIRWMLFADESHTKGGIKANGKENC